MSDNDILLSLLVQEDLPMFLNARKVIDVLYRFFPTMKEKYKEKENPYYEGRNENLLSLIYAKGEKILLEINQANVFVRVYVFSTPAVGVDIISNVDQTKMYIVIDSLDEMYETLQQCFTLFKGETK